MSEQEIKAALRPLAEMRDGHIAEDWMDISAKQALDAVDAARALVDHEPGTDA